MGIIIRSSYDGDGEEPSSSTSGFYEVIFSLDRKRWNRQWSRNQMEMLLFFSYSPLQLSFLNFHLILITLSTP